MDWDRRAFLRGAGAGTAAALCPTAALWPTTAGAADDAATPGDGERFVREARYWEPLAEDRVRCTLCPRRCEVADRERGTCGVRENREGRYVTLDYGRCCAIHADPIEKKPFFHVLPGQRALSIAAAGCNIECRFCQNWEISQFRPEQIEATWLPPQAVVDRAIGLGCPAVAFTYSEPVVFHEYMVDTARAGKPRGIRGLMVSNGYILEAPMREACEVLSAVKIDLKAFTDDFYRRVCGGRLEPVLDTLKLLSRLGVWTEIVVLLVPGLNDSPGEIGEMSRWIAGEMGADVPVHFSRFHPCYRMTDLPPTPIATLERSCEIAGDHGLHFVYLGNVPGHPGEQTRCPGCGEVVIRRYGFRVIENRLLNGRCPDCDRPVPGLWGTGRPVPPPSKTNLPGGD